MRRGTRDCTAPGCGWPAATAAAPAAAAAAGGAAEPHLSTFALRIKIGEVLDQFVAAVNAHKAASGGKKAEAAA